MPAQTGRPCRALVVRRAHHEGDRDASDLIPSLSEDLILTRSKNLILTQSKNLILSLSKDGVRACRNRAHPCQIFHAPCSAAILPENAVCVTRRKPARAIMAENSAGAGTLRIDSTRYW